jgi:hypothetical protein
MGNLPTNNDPHRESGNSALTLPVRGAVISSKLEPGSRRSQCAVRTVCQYSPFSPG